MVQTSVADDSRDELNAADEPKPSGGGDRLQTTQYERLQHALQHDKRCLREISVGKRVGFYRIKGDLGAGNFSQVKMAVHSLTKETVAMKILDKTALHQKTLRLLTREISSMERLKHPNIIRLYEVLETTSKLYMIMEYASGGELFTRIAGQGRLSETEAQTVFCQIVAAIKHMHERNIIHRDLKAENVFYAAPMYVKVGDFGFSKYSAPSERLLTFCGSPPYAAPELFQEDAYEGRYVDVWALGVVLHFMVTGATPFRGDTVGKLRRRILAGDYATPPHVSADCRSLVCGLLRRAPDERLSLDAVQRSPWLRGHEFPPAPRPYEHDPELALSSASADEREATRELKKLGITASVIRRAGSAAGGGGSGRAPRSSVTGAYRIVLHRIQRERSRASRDADGDRSAPASAIGAGSGGGDRRGGGGGRMYNSDLAGKPLSKLCTIV